ncbi:TniB family NTP-binding protein [Streptomyces sp. TRM66268-LWL]|uniref:TniB family NTP-binding protein n=1 Tax=Streptomyces polyasparticus TaxID=2767826 RepID=A0ABR7SSC4_9ACTN|nr:TniB family NTP-binding protein [Streptomyces polyasparticus]MBC9718401.1 TniB family NTP-binding protein [Streptomyces polyasparticus]
MTLSNPAARRTILRDADAEAGRQLNTLTGWRRFIDSPPEPPALASRSARRRMSAPERDLYDEDRLDHHARMLTIATSFVEKTAICGRRLVLLNRHAISARRGLIVSGPAGTGKTIAITQLGRSHELLDRARHPHVTDRIPVVYVTVPPAATARMIATEFARFLGLPVRARSNMTDIIEAVVGVCTDTRTGLVLVDELHNISLTSRHGAEVADTLKYFSERLAATFVYAGIDIAESSLLSGTRGAQIAGRFTLIPSRPFPYNTEWQGLVATMEGALRLHDHRPGTLTDLARFLHDHAGGMIGSLSHAIRGAALDAILTGTEKITKRSLQAIPLDHSAHTAASLATKSTTS